jgi:ZIP family zinc transporter
VGVETEFFMLTGESIVAAGFAASLATGIATGIGALPLFLVRRISARLEDVFLGFAAGVMLAAAFFSLIIPALDVAEARFAGKTGAALVVIASPSRCTTCRKGSPWASVSAAATPPTD